MQRNEINARVAMILCDEISLVTLNSCGIVSCLQRNISIRWFRVCAHVLFHSRYVQFFVSWVFGSAARVADLCAEHTFRGAKQRIRTPKAAHAKRGRFILAVDLVQQIWTLDGVILKFDHKNRNNPKN